MPDIEAVLPLVRGLIKRVENKLRGEIKTETEERKTADANLSDRIDGITDRLDDLKYLPVFQTPSPPEGWQVNWLFDQAWYLGGMKPDCSDHPPVINGNYTSWVILVLNGMRTEPGGKLIHRLQIAWDIMNAKCYMRRGWTDSNKWSPDGWAEVGGGAAGGTGGAETATAEEVEAMLTEVFG